jgi:hypothetical protein
VRIIPAEGHAEDAYAFKAPPGRFYRQEDEEKVIEKVVEHLDARYPYWNFRMVKVGAGKYNFVYDGLREKVIDSGRHEEDDESSCRPSVKAVEEK